jgi:hypothetical protein
MSLDERLLARIRAEYREMPGLRLTLPQACRLWQLAPEPCHALLDRLVSERVLHRMQDGSYISFPSTRQVKATLPAEDENPIHRRG